MYIKPSPSLSIEFEFNTSKTTFVLGSVFKTCRYLSNLKRTSFSLYSFVKEKKSYLKYLPSQPLLFCEIFFFIALFFSYLRSSMISGVFTKVGHRFIRQIRHRHILSGERDYTPFEAGDAGRLTTRTRRIRLLRSRRVGHLSSLPVSSGVGGATSACCRCRRIRQAQQKPCAHPARQPAPHSPLLSFSLCSFSLHYFSLCSSQFSSNLSFSNLIPSILRAFVDQNQ
jgi:hypothetical protein